MEGQSKISLEELKKRKRVKVLLPLKNGVVKPASVEVVPLVDVEGNRMGDVVKLKGRFSQSWDFEIHIENLKDFERWQIT